MDTSLWLGGSVYKIEGGSAASFKRWLGGWRATTTSAQDSTAPSRMDKAGVLPEGGWGLGGSPRAHRAPLSREPANPRSVHQPHLTFSIPMLGQTT